MTVIPCQFAGYPRHRDRAVANYRLQNGAIDAGSSVDAPAIDFDGRAQPLDGDGDTPPGFDIGAFEAPAL